MQTISHSDSVIRNFHFTPSIKLQSSNFYIFIQIVTLAVLVAVAAAAPQGYETASGYGHAAPAYGHSAKAVDADYDSNPEYSFNYEVNDEHTGDVKSQQETRHGDVVEGSYTLIEADGTRRIVHYKADDHSGFNAVVEKEGVPQTPVAHKYAAAPVAQVPYHGAQAYSAPAYGYQH